MESEPKVQYRVIRSKRRRRIALRITDTGDVLACVPYKVPGETIRQFVETHTHWIEQKLQHLDQLPRSHGPHSYEDKDVFYFMEERLELKIIYGKIKKTTCSRQGDKLVVHASSRATPVAIRRAIISWYREEGLHLYEGLVANWLAEIGSTKFKRPILVDMANFPKRWGSCSQKGELRFALRSLLLPRPIVEYLALHEVAHLLHFNHGAEFKRLLDLQMPNWRERQKEMNRLRLWADAL